LEWAGLHFRRLSEKFFADGGGAFGGWPGHGGISRQGAIVSGSQAAQGSPENKERN
jgi:hypothetical protein